MTTTISSETSVLDILQTGASATYFSLLEEGNKLSKEQIDRNKKVEDEISSMSDAVSKYQNGIKNSLNQTAIKIKDGISNPINTMREESITAYTNFTESIVDMREGVSQKLVDVKEGFSTKVDGLRTGLTDVVNKTNTAMEGMSVKMEAFSKLPTEKQILLAGKVIADGVMSTVSSIPEVVSKGMDKLDKGISAVGGFVKSSSGYLKSLFIKSEESEDVGGTSGLSEPNTKPETDDGDGIGGLLNGLPIPKGLKKFGKMAGKFAGKLALPLAVLGAGISFVDGIKNAADIVGRSNEELSGVEKAGAGLASIVSNLTFGLVSAQSIYSEGVQVIDSISGFASDMYNRLPDGVKGVTDKIGSFLFSSEGGVFSSIGGLFNSTIDAIAKGDWATVAINSIFGPFKAIMGADGIIANTAKGVFDLLPNSFKESITEFGDTLMGFFESIKTMASDLIPDSLKNFFSNVSESDTGQTVSRGLDVAKSFLGFGDKEETKETDRKSISEVAINKKIIKPSISANKTITTETEELTNSPIVENKRRQKVVLEKRNSIEGIRSKPKPIENSDAATKKSKAVMNKKTNPAPIVVQAPAQKVKQVGSGKTINTSTSIGDTELAVMNSNMMD